MLTVESESRFVVKVSLDHHGWSTIRRTLVTLKGGEEVAEVVDAAMRSSPAWGSFSVRLTNGQFDLLESAYARIC